MILMYHNIDNEGNFNTVSKSNFIEQMFFLENNNYNIIPFDSYYELISKNKLSREFVTITFDDAYVSFMDYVVPILEKYQIPVTLFVPLGFVDKFNEWDYDKTQRRLKILNWEQLKTLSNNILITIGSHGVSHCSIGSLTKERIIFEISDSKRIIEQTLNILVRYFSFPYGQSKDINPTAIQALKDSGYLAACGTNFSIINKYKDLFKLSRLEIEPTDDIRSFVNKIRNYYHIRLFKQKLKNVLHKIGLK